MRSCAYTGTVVHRRFGPVEHRFRYPLCIFLLDLDELSGPASRLRLFGVNRPNLVSFWDRDHLDGRDGDSREKIRSFLRSEGIEPPDGRILLLTQCRVAHYVFNPVCFWFCEDREGAVRAVVAEVNSTFGERLLYALSERDALPDRLGRLRYGKRKGLHVSPFLSMDCHYEFLLSPPRERLSVGITEDESGERRLHASMQGTRRPLTDGTLAGLLVRYPLMTLRITTAIHAQAARLWWKGAPFHRQPPPSAEQRLQAARSFVPKER